jgi:hypothetical protein
MKHPLPAGEGRGEGIKKRFFIKKIPFNSFTKVKMMLKSHLNPLTLTLSRRERGQKAIARLPWLLILLILSYFNMQAYNTR